jgi:uncharacterized membrane protein YfcA
MIETYPIILVVGIFVGLASTIFGVGGGIIMVPALSLILPYGHIEAVATSLATIVLVAGFNTYNFSKRDVIVWSIVPWIAVASSVFAYVFARISTHLPESVLILIFLLFLLYTAMRTFLIKQDSEKSAKTKNKWWVPVGIGSVSGMVSGLTGIGGGGITTPMMMVTRLVKNVQAAPTSNAIMIFTTFFSSLAFAFSESGLSQPFMLGYIHLDTALLLFLGSALVSRFGVGLNHKVPLIWRKTILGMLLLFICIRLLFLLI